MRLTKVNIQAYRSLYSVELVPRPFTVLVGPNNAGKTNLAGALEFLGRIARHGLEVAVGREGGFENLAFRRQRRTRMPVKFEFQAELNRGDSEPQHLRQFWPADTAIRVKYMFALRAADESRDADFRVTDELLDIRIYQEMVHKNPENAPVIEVKRRNNAITISMDKELEKNSNLQLLVDPFGEDGFLEYLQRLLEPTDLALNRMAFNQPVSALLENLGQTRLFQLTPVECRKAGSSTPSPELERHGGNLPGVVRYMQRNEPDAWERTLNAMRRIVPDLSTISTEFTTGRRLALLFQERGARAWNADEVSDGTIQSLALFTCLFDPRIPFALIEEPENSVHPWIVRTFADACREAQGKQVLVTTHSPALMSYLTPDELEIMWRSEDGHTHLCPLGELDPDAPRLWSNGKIDLYDLIDGGWVRESVPPGMQ
jgi:predicted ATPase